MISAGFVHGNGYRMGSSGRSFMDLGRARGGVWDILSGTWEETGTRFVSQLYGVLGAFFSFSGNFLRLDCCHYYPHLALLDTSSDVFFFFGAGHPCLTLYQYDWMVLVSIFVRMKILGNFTR